jgi:hypothetical protein
VKFIQIGILCLICTVGLVPFTAAQKLATPPAAPIPVQILSAKKVFLSNAGNDVPPNDRIPVDLPFNELYVSVQTWGRYELVPAPADADLIFEFHYQRGIPAEWPQLRLVILDPKTHVVLWTFAQEVDVHDSEFVSNGEVRKNFDKAMNALLNQLRAKLGEPPLPVPGAKPSKKPEKPGAIHIW